MPTPTPQNLEIVRKDGKTHNFFTPSLSGQFRNSHPKGCYYVTLVSEDAIGGWKKRGEENLTNDTPPKKGFWTPPRTVRFPPPSDVSAVFFLYKNPRKSRPEALLEGSKNFRESVFSGTLSSAHTFCTPPYHGPTCRWLITVISSLAKILNDLTQNKPCQLDAPKDMHCSLPAGSFYAPAKILIDTAFCQTLPKGELFSGKSECSRRVRGGEPEGVRKHLLSKKVFVCSKKVFRRKKGF